jgi:tRNA synthetases class I (W and Y)
MTDRTLSLAVKPIIHYPREAQVGKTYLMTIDLQPEEGFEWQYEEEEYPIYCKVDSELFSSKPVGEPVVVLHRFGGSYGKAKFLLTASLVKQEGYSHVTLINRWGVSIQTLSLSSILSDIDAISLPMHPLQVVLQQTEQHLPVRERVLLGIQPASNLHLGDYLGSIRNLVVNQAEYENFLCIVDLHAIAVPHDPQTLARNSYGIAALYLACGISVEHSRIFIQSHIPAHSELAWLLNCTTPLNWLQDMIQFKETTIKQGENVNVGLLDYPVLMAADILLYQSDKVPVGEGQRQYVELIS